MWTAVISSTDTNYGLVPHPTEGSRNGGFLLSYLGFACRFSPLHRGICRDPKAGRSEKQWLLNYTLPRGLARRKATRSFINHFTSHRRLPFNYLRSLYHSTHVISFIIHKLGERPQLRRSQRRPKKTGKRASIRTPLRGDLPFQFEKHFGAMKYGWIHFHPVWVHAVWNRKPPCRFASCFCISFSTVYRTKLQPDLGRKCRQKLVREVRNRKATGMVRIKTCFNAVLLIWTT